MTDPESAAIHSMFGRIARRYDLANHVLSFGLDRGWRRRLVEAVGRRAPRDILDLATGSGDVAFALGAGLPGEARITGMDRLSANAVSPLPVARSITDFGPNRHTAATRLARHLASEPPLRIRFARS